MTNYVTTTFVGPIIRSDARFTSKDKMSAHLSGLLLGLQLTGHEAVPANTHMSDELVRYTYSWEDVKCTIIVHVED
jgi:hypothetical protein